MAKEGATTHGYIKPEADKVKGENHIFITKIQRMERKMENTSWRM